MTKLISTYAAASGLLIDHPDVKETFYPQPWERYITLQSGAGQNAKAYSAWQEVVALLKPILDANKVAILLLGGKDDPLVNGVHDLRGKTSILQTHYLVKRALCHMGNDSWIVHCAGWNYRPLVALYGSTSVANHGPYWYDPAKTVLLESHRCGGVPTYAMQEVPKTIDYIAPETVANAVLRLLGIGDQFPFATTYVGPLYQHSVLELIPNTVPAPAFCPGLPMTVRMDLAHNAEVLAGVLQTGRKVHIVTKAPIDLNLLGQCRPSIATYSHEVTLDNPEPSLQYVDAIRSLFPTSHAFFTRELDEAKVAELRFRYFDHVTVTVQKDLTRDDYVAGVLAYLNRPDTPENRLDIVGQLSETFFRTNRYVLTDGCIYVSHAHLTARQPISSLADNTGPVIDSPAFWKDLQHYTTRHVPSSPP